MQTQFDIEESIRVHDAGMFAKPGEPVGDATSERVRRPKRIVRRMTVAQKIEMEKRKWHTTNQKRAAVALPVAALLGALFGEPARLGVELLLPGLLRLFGL